MSSQEKWGMPKIFSRYFQDLTLGAAHVGDQRVSWRDARQCRQQAQDFTHRSGEYDEIGVACSKEGIFFSLVDRTLAESAFQNFRPVTAHAETCKAALLECNSPGAAHQAQANDRDTTKGNFRQRHDCARPSAPGTRSRFQSAFWKACRPPFRTFGRRRAQSCATRSSAL